MRKSAERDQNATITRLSRDDVNISTVADAGDGRSIRKKRATYPTGLRIRVVFGSLQQMICEDILHGFAK